MSNFGERFKIIRKTRGLTLEEIEADVRISNSNLSKIERNKISPSIEIAIKLAEYLGTSLDYLAKGTVNYELVSSDTVKLIELYHILNNENKVFVLQFLEFIVSKPYSLDSIASGKFQYIHNKLDKTNDVKD